MYSENTTQNLTKNKHDLNLYLNSLFIKNPMPNG